MNIAQLPIMLRTIAQTCRRRRFKRTKISTNGFSFRKPNESPVPFPRVHGATSSVYFLPVSETIRYATLHASKRNRLFFQLQLPRDRGGSSLSVANCNRTATTSRMFGGRLFPCDRLHPPPPRSGNGGQRTRRIRNARQMRISIRANRRKK